ncbi:hypothetical protein ACVMAJ_006855 [Bradyrhizobium sp. USDA 4448]
MVNDANFTLTISDGTVISDTVRVTPKPPVLTPVAVAGAEGVSIGLNPGLSISSLSGDSNSLSSLIVSAVPVGATLTDGSGHSFTATAGNTSIDLTNWSLASLAITPINDTNFSLTFSATEKDAQGNLSTTTAATELVTVKPAAPTLSLLSPSVGGIEGSAIFRWIAFLSAFVRR